MTNDRLAKGFVTELLAYALVNRGTFEIVKMYLKYSYLQKEAEKKLVQFLFRYYDKRNRVATYGQIQQEFRSDDDALELLADISNVEVDDTGEGHDSIVSTFQEYLKQMKFLESNDKILEAYNRGDKEQAYSLFAKLASELNDFNIVSSNIEPVFGGFRKRMIQRRTEGATYRYKVPTMIDELDYILGGDNGGPETGEFYLGLGMSGAGKSQYLIHLGISAARQGHAVIHFQLEGTREQCLNRFDAAWTGTLYRDMKIGNVAAKKMDVLDKIIKKLKKSDIYVISCEKWGGMTLVDIRRIAKEIIKKHGNVGAIVIDYLELMELGDGIKYLPSEERFRREKLARGCKALAMELNCVVHSVTQSNDISMEEMNDPEFVLSRNNLNEARNVIRPVDGFFTFNCTMEESKNQVMRFFVDKAREYASKQIIRIANNFKCARFYDRKRTADLIDEEDEEE